MYVNCNLLPLVVCMLLSSTLFVVIRMSQCSFSEPQMSVVPLSYPASVSLALCATYEFRDVALSRCDARQGRKKRIGEEWNLLFDYNFR